MRRNAEVDCKWLPVPRGTGIVFGCEIRVRSVTDRQGNFVTTRRVVGMGRIYCGGIDGAVTKIPGPFRYCSKRGISKLNGKRNSAGESRRICLESCHESHFFHGNGFGIGRRAVDIFCR